VTSVATRGYRHATRSSIDRPDSLRVPFARKSSAPSRSSSPSATFETASPSSMTPPSPPVPSPSVPRCPDPFDPCDLLASCCHAACYEYKRHGTQALLAAFDVRTGAVVGEVVPHRTAEALVSFSSPSATPTRRFSWCGTTSTSTTTARTSAGRSSTRGTEVGFTSSTRPSMAHERTRWSRKDAGYGRSMVGAGCMLRRLLQALCG
jgi:hypothetical protein